MRCTLYDLPNLRRSTYVSDETTIHQDAQPTTNLHIFFLLRREVGEGGGGGEGTQLEDFCYFFFFCGGGGTGGMKVRSCMHYNDEED